MNQPSIQVPGDLRSRVLKSIEANPSKTRRNVVSAAIVLTVSLVGLGLASFDALGGYNAGPRPAPFVGATVAGWVAVALVATWVIFGGRSMTGRPRSVLIAVAIATPLVLLGWMHIWNEVYPVTKGTCPGFSWWGKACLDLTVVFALIPLLALTLFRAGTDPVHPGAMGAALGAAMGAWAGITLDLTCPCANPTHVAIGHVLPVALMAGFGVWLGRRFLALHGRPS